MSKLADFI